MGKKKILAGLAGLMVVLCVAFTATFDPSNNTVSLEDVRKDMGSVRPAGSIELKLGMSVPISGSWGEAVQTFARLLEEATGGRYYVMIYGNDELSGGNQVGGIEMLQSGATDLYVQDVLIWSSIEPKLAAPAFPWLFRSNDEADAAMRGDGGQAIKEMVSEVGAVCIGIGSNGFRQLVNTRRPVASPADMEGLKIRVPGINMYVELFKDLGADPVTMSASERYTALQQGAIDGCENPLELHITQKDAEVVKYCTIWNYSYDPVLFCASEKLWSSLSDEDKTIFSECGQKAMDVMIAALRSSEEGYREQMENEFGIEFTDLAPEQLGAFQKAAQPVYQTFKDSIGEDVFEAFGYKF